MPVFTEQELDKINNGEPVDEAVLNRPSLSLLEMVNYLGDIIFKLLELVIFDSLFNNSSKEVILLTPLAKENNFTIEFLNGEYVLRFTKPIYLFWRYNYIESWSYIIKINEGTKVLGNLQNPVCVYILGDSSSLSNAVLSQSLYSGRSIERNIKVGEVSGLVHIGSSFPAQIEQGNFYIELFKINKKGDDFEITYLTQGLDISGLDGIYVSWLKNANINVIEVLSSYINNVSGFLRGFFTPGVIPTTSDFMDCKVSVKEVGGQKYVVVNRGSAIMPNGVPVFVPDEISAQLPFLQSLDIYLTYDIFYKPTISFSSISGRSLKLAQIGAGGSVEDVRVRSKLVVPTSAVFRSYYSMTDAIEEGELRYSSEGKVFGYASSKDATEFDVLATLSRIGIVQHTFYKPAGEMEFITSGGSSYVVLPPCTLIRWDAKFGGSYQGASVSLVFNQTISFEVWYDEDNNLYAGTRENYISLSQEFYISLDATITFTFALHIVPEFK